MVLLSFPNTIPCRVITKSFTLFSQASNSHHFQRSLHKTYFSKQASIRWSPESRRRGLSLVPFDAKNSVPPEEDKRALEAVLKFYTAIKNKSINELSEVIGDECHRFSNFISFFRPFEGKKQVLDFFSCLTQSLSNKIEFVVQPTLHDGINVAVRWNLECNKTHAPLGKGFSFHLFQTYVGRLQISNVEMLIKPLLHLEPFRLKLTQYVITLVSKIFSYIKSRDKAKKAILPMLALLLTTSAIVTIKHIL